ncbi:MAG: 6,7-dimethyl-8-ribityllumazine synthase [Alphaproteobacteria bacterium]|nr:6,7-dimethyl-8-ribityllumazine synthase [Alphaproteobacteria bacterium]
MSAGPHLLIIEARFYTHLSDFLAAGAIKAIEAHKGTYRRIEVPGSLEIPGVVRMAVEAMERGATEERFDGFVALGCVIRGETSHYDHVCQESIRGLQELVLRHGIAVGMGILTCENEAQASERARPDRGNKGAAAAEAALTMIAVRRSFRLP